MNLPRVDSHHAVDECLEMVSKSMSVAALALESLGESLSNKLLTLLGQSCSQVLQVCQANGGTLSPDGCARVEGCALSAESGAASQNSLLNWHPPSRHYLAFISARASSSLRPFVAASRPHQIGFFFQAVKGIPATYRLKNKAVPSTHLPFINKIFEPWELLLSNQPEVAS